MTCPMTPGGKRVRLACAQCQNLIICNHFSRLSYSNLVVLYCGKLPKNLHIYSRLDTLPPSGWTTFKGTPIYKRWLFILGGYFGEGNPSILFPSDGLVLIIELLGPSLWMNHVDALPSSADNRSTPIQARPKLCLGSLTESRSSRSLPRSGGWSNDSDQYSCDWGCHSWWTPCFKRSLGSASLIPRSEV